MGTDTGMSGMTRAPRTPSGHRHAERGPTDLCLCFRSGSKASGTVQEEQYHSPRRPSPQLLQENKTAQSKTLQLFPLKKSDSQCIRRKITTGAGTTALNGDIDSNGSITPLLGRAAGTRAVHSVSDSARTTHRVSPHVGPVPGRWGRMAVVAPHPLQERWGPARCAQAGAGFALPWPQSRTATRPRPHRDFRRAARSSGATAQG